MSTRDMTHWETAIWKVVSKDGEEEIAVRGHRLSELVGRISFAEAMFLMLQGRLPTPGQARVLDALLVASIEHGIAPPSMISRCFASYGTSIQAAVGSGIAAFGDRMGGLGEQLAQQMAGQLAPQLAQLRDPATIGEEQLRVAARAIVDGARRGGDRARSRLRLARDAPVPVDGAQRQHGRAFPGGAGAGHDLASPAGRPDHLCRRRAGPPIGAMTV
jgi:hypothetical protein